MARDESSREDLLREATALVERIEIAIAAADPLPGRNVVAGFRKNGALSVFFDEDPVYQFNAAGELRRAYSDGRLLKATNGQLVALDRIRTSAETQLVRVPLDHEEQSAFLARMTGLLRQLSKILESTGLEIVGQVPAGADVLGRLRSWLTSHDQLSVAQLPNA
jgi:hypothetical protein